MIHTMLCISGVFLLSACALVVGANWWLSLCWYLRRKRSSLTPFVGGLLGTLGLVLLPFDGTVGYWWVPIVLDPGCGLLLAAIALEFLKRVWSEHSSGRERRKP
jgi:phosphate/sulfate permease